MYGVLVALLELEVVVKKLNGISLAIDFTKSILHPAPTDIYHVQLVRSLIVSFLAVIVNFGGSFVFKQELKWNYLLATTISFYLGVLVNYYLSVKWVFATRKLASRHAEFAIFVVITTVGWLFNEAIIAGMVEVLNTGFWLALLVATILVFFWNFLARKKLLY